MKRISILLLSVFMLFVFLINISWGAEKNKSEKGGDELQRQYLSKLIDLDFKIRFAGLEYLKNISRKTSLTEEEFIELRHRGRIPIELKLKRSDLEFEGKKIDRDLEDLRSEKSNLKLEALKYYRGKMPKWLSEKWKEQERDHIKWQNDHTEKINEEIAKMKEVSDKYPSLNQK